MKIGWLVSGLGLLPVAAGAQEAARNLNASYPPVTQPGEGISWPKGQALPTFAAPAAALDTLVVQDLSKDEQITFSALQGQVNRRQPRILLLDARAGEGRDTWAKTLNFGVGTAFSQATKYDLLAKYAKEVTGVVLYEPAKSPHYRNLAGTVAAQRRALPATAEVFALMRQKGIALEVVEDLTTLAFTTPIEIYQHLYDRYWPKSEKRLIVSAKPLEERGGGDFHHTRDMAAATGAAVVWLNTLDPAEREVLKKFFRDMTAGEAIALGWYTTERSGIPTATEFGIGTMPADFFMSSTVFASTDHRIKIPPVPKMPPLENKAYVAIIISDGDNIQYTQHAMRQNWDRTAATRGKMPLSWTIAPGLVDIAPGIMNYYYSSATPNDCFVTGPSGMGYLMPFNTLTEPGAPTGDKLTDPVRMDGYARLTETYLQRSGLRVATIWDDMTPMQRQSYEKHCRHLYGATVQNFRDVRSVAGSIESDRLPFDKLVIPYTSSYDHLHGSLSQELKKWDGKSPLFLAYQVDVWGKLSLDRLVALQEQLGREFPDQVRFVRADHYFNLSNEANALPFNLCLAATTTVTSGSGPADAATDGTPVTLWSAAEPEKRWLKIDFGAPYQLSRYVLRHAGESGLSRDLNTKAYTVEASADGKTWQTADHPQGDGGNVTDVEFKPTVARYFKITVTDPGGDTIARIAEVEVYGKVISDR